VTARIRFGPAGRPLSLKSGSLLEIPSFLCELGLSAMEYEAVRGVRIDEAKAKMFGAEARKYDITLSLHAPYAINLASKDEAIVGASIERLKAAIKASAIMGAYIVVFHPGWYGDALSRREAVERVIRNLEPVVEYMNQHGFRSLWLGVETTGRIKEVGSLDEVIEISSRFDRIRPVIDFAHIYARAAGKFIISKDDVLKVIDALERSLGREYVRPLHAHFSKVEFNKHGEVRHRALSDEGYGPGFRYVCEALCETGVEAVVISESPLLELDALKMKRVCEEICGSKCVSEQYAI